MKISYIGGLLPPSSNPGLKVLPPRAVLGLHVGRRKLQIPGPQYSVEKVSTVGGRPATQRLLQRPEELVTQLPLRQRRLLRAEGFRQPLNFRLTRVPCSLLPVPRPQRRVRATARPLPAAARTHAFNAEYDCHAPSWHASFLHAYAVYAFGVLSELSSTFSSAE
jgi:hypothetical protein